MEELRVRVWIDNKPFDGSIVSSNVSSTGLVKVQLDDGTLVARHVSRVDPINTAARDFLVPAPTGETPR